MKRRNISLFMGVLGVFMIGLGSFLLVNDKSFSENNFDNQLENNIKNNIEEEIENSLIQNDSEVIEEENNKSEIVAPAKNTKELLKTMNEVEIISFDGEEIKFSKDVDILEGEKISVWVYSEPKFLGIFEVILEDGIKKIDGLSTALKNITIDSGDHNIAMTTMDGKDIGYIDIFVSKNGVVSDIKEEAIIKEENVMDEVVVEDVLPKTTVKEVVETLEIPFKVLQQKEINMLRDTKEIIQVGVTGVKEIKYNVTYDENGKEILKEKVSEKVVRKAVEQIETIGTSDYNLNTDYIKGTMFGPVCTEDKTYIAEDGYKYCNDIDNKLTSFFAIKINDDYYVSCFDSDECQTNSLVNVDNIFKISSVNPYLYSGNFNGTLYYFDARGGAGSEEKLTLELCSKYSLSCGSW